MLKISFIDLLKVFLFASLRRGEKEHKTSPLLIVLMDAQLTAFSKYSLIWSPVFWCKKLSYFKLIITVKNSTFKNTGNEMQESNGSSSRYFVRLGDGTLLWPFDLRRHAPIWTPVRILVIHSVLEHNSEVFSWEDCFPHLKHFLIHWVCCSCTVVIGSHEVWPEGSCSGLTPCKESQIPGFAMESCAIQFLLVLRGLRVFSCFTTKLSIEILRYLEFWLAVALLRLNRGVALFMVDTGTGTCTASVCWTEC